jgi:hypothetical protein
MNCSAVRRLSGGRPAHPKVDHRLGEILSVALCLCGEKLLPDLR